MRAIIKDCSTDILLTSEEVKQFCKPESVDTCIWLLGSSIGFECCYYNKPWSLVERFDKGETNAKRDGCDRVKNFKPGEQDKNEVEF